MALQPTIATPLAQWALGNTAGSSSADRSGNGRTLSGLGPASLCPDLRTRHKALINLAANPGGAQRSDAALRLTGAMTLTARVWTFGAFGSATEQTIAACLNGGGETEADNILYALQIGGGIGAPQVLRYRCESGLGIDANVDSALALVIGRWYFVGLRRNAAATSVTFTRGDAASNVHQTAAATAPTGGSAGVFTIYARDSGGGGFFGGVADVCLWDTELTDAQMETLRAAAMTTGA